MITCEKLGALVVVGLGLLQHVGAANMWMGMPIQGRSGLFERQLLDCGEGRTPCGNVGCMPIERCCNPDGKDYPWVCGANEACYTVSETVDCYLTTTTTATPTTARRCYDYTATGCPEWIGCFQCLETAAPFCYTKSATGTTDIWIVCNTVGGSDPVIGSATATRTATSSDFSSTAATARPIASSASGSTSTPDPSSPAATGESGGATISTGAIAGIAIAGFAAASTIGVLAFLLYRKRKNAQQSQSQPQPQPLMNDIDRHSDMAKHEPVLELSGDVPHPQMEIQELDSYPIKDRTPTSGPSELV